MDSGVEDQAAPEAAHHHYNLSISETQAPFGYTLAEGGEELTRPRDSSSEVPVIVPEKSGSTFFEEDRAKSNSFKKLNLSRKNTATMLHTAAKILISDDLTGTGGDNLD
jgi:hypothetical protein